MKRTRACALILSFFVCLFLLFPSTLRAQVDDTVLRQLRIKREFLKSLSEGERLRLLREIEDFRQYNSALIGAKYKWGYIPVDRKPPSVLGTWWRSLSPGQRRKQRLKWFEKHMMQINVDRAAALLGLEERLIKIDRKYREKFVFRSIKLEPISPELEKKEEPGDDETRKEFPEREEETQESAREKDTIGEEDEGEKTEKKRTRQKVEEKLSQVEKEGKQKPVKEKDREAKSASKKQKDKETAKKTEKKESGTAKKNAEKKNGEKPVIPKAQEKETEVDTEPRKPYYLYQRTGDQVEIMPSRRPSEDIDLLRNISPRPDFDPDNQLDISPPTIRGLQPPVRFSE